MIFSPCKGVLYCIYRLALFQIVLISGRACFRSYCFRTAPIPDHAHFKLCRKRPLASFGSNQVDFGGITISLSATASRSVISTG